MQKHAGSFDFILDTVSADHDLNAYLQLLKLNGTMTLVGAPPEAIRGGFVQLDCETASVSRFRRSVEFARQQEMLDFCAVKRNQR